MQALERRRCLTNRPLWAQDFTVGRFVLGQIDTFRRYFTEIGLISCPARRRLSGAPARTAGARPLRRRERGVAEAGPVRRWRGGPRIRAGRPRVGDDASGTGSSTSFLPSSCRSSFSGDSCSVRSSQHPTRLLRALRVVCVLDVLIASAYWLHFRHTRVEAYAVEADGDISRDVSDSRSLDRAEPDGGLTALTASLVTGTLHQAHEVDERLNAGARLQRPRAAGGQEVKRLASIAYLRTL